MFAELFCTVVNGDDPKRLVVLVFGLAAASVSVLFEKEPELQDPSNTDAV